ncbi:MAG: U32 family peptidase [Treponema sp.]|jgi:putative protease|nr:U32 family peptidase [Treponema sp.]
MFIELLAPAGSPEALDAAVREGADAVYLGLKNFNARMRSANFAYSQFEGALRTLRRMGKKIYVTVNTVFEQREADRMYQLLKYLAGIGPDGLIVQDFGVAAMVRGYFPSLKIHASTQMNIASARGANALSKYGISRVVMARELCLRELQKIRANTNMELEVFVHGALCVSASGLCLFSSYLGGKSANRGMCTQACRRLYRRDDDEGYYFSPADLQLLDRVPELAAAGVNSFKIEGRMKSAEYVGAVVSAYRRVIDAAAQGEEARIQESIREGLEILRGDFARTKTVFYFDWKAGAHSLSKSRFALAPEDPDSPQKADSRGADGQAEPQAAVEEQELPPPDSPPDSGAPIGWLNPAQDGGTGISLGPLLKVKGAGEERRGLISAGPGPAAFYLPVPGDSVRLHRADDSNRKSHKISSVEDFTSAGVLHAWISIPEGFEPGDRVYLIQTRSMGKRYAPVIPRDVGSFKRRPGRDKAPPLELPPVRRGDAPFPEGIYAAVSRTEDLYIVQSSRPVRVMLSYTRKTAARLLGKAPLPFRPGEIILVLEPFFPQAMEKLLGEEIPLLLEKGYHQFMVNNPGHCSFFRSPAPGQKKPLLIAGPYLYIFNRWAEQFVSSLGAGAFVSPLENNRQNLERTISPARRSLVFVTVFAWPALFRIRANLGPVYQFGEFSGGRNERFTLISEADGSQVLPEKPFSIVDKIPFLREAGFGRFILDFSGPPLKKARYRELIHAAETGLPLPGVSRFNWKDGFYHLEEGGTKGSEG